MSPSSGGSPDGRASKSPLAQFLARNPFGHPLTEGFFYREKMRAIHRVAPAQPLRDVLEIGGGQGGLTALLYPGARITTVDLDPGYATAPCNRQPHVRFVCADATALPFRAVSFDAVTMFDVLEHIPDDRRAAAEALRVLRPRGFLLVSSPNEHWRFPYYGVMRSICPTEADMFAEWGHVRRGYDLAELQRLIGLPLRGWATFINPLTVICHDFAWSRLRPALRRLICTALTPITWVGYLLLSPHARGTETASAWQRE